MLLSPYELELFIDLHSTLMFYANERLDVVPDNVASPAELAGLPLTLRKEVHDALYTHPELIDEFVEENPASFPKDELDIVRSWKHFVFGDFFILKETNKHAVFLSTATPRIAYGVVGLSQPFRDIFRSPLPTIVTTTLLPFQGRIVFSGILSGYNLTLGSGIREELKEEYKVAAAGRGIVTSLPMADAPTPSKATSRESDPKSSTSKRKKKSVKASNSEELANPVKTAKATKATGGKKAVASEANEALAAVIGLIDQFCATHLNEEYAMVCRKLAEKLARKRPSPLLQGKPNAWASGIIRAIGGANFLHDKTQKPYMRSTDIDRALGTSPSSGAVKLAAIREMFGVFHHDPEWMLPSRLEDNPLVWMLKVNGVMMDIRDAPREAQEVAFEQGLIPYIPADRE